ncbi:hypothetical protein B0H65DRAFT_549242 [Neurospora tetraspora]|uniref:Uncharacterized protein n=1 Tax=Neurospora tetraspora TaxID=94610 RepID=A0AAE0JGH1_9PEZI|nr:hypothetical protein B0H65DRAFT_549242 [Neurospora tetraspora]
MDVFLLKKASGPAKLTNACQWRSKCDIDDRDLENKREPVLQCDKLGNQKHDKFLQFDSGIGLDNGNFVCWKFEW